MPPDSGEIMPFCTRCGGAVDAKDRFCRECGGEVRARASAPPSRPIATSPAPEIPLRTDAALEPVPLHGDADATAGPLTPIASPHALRFAAPVDRSPDRRLVVIIGCFAIVAMSGVVVYRWFNRAVPERQPVAAEATEQALDAPASTIAIQRPGSAATVRPAAPPDAPHSGETSNVILDFTKDTTDAANVLGAPDGRVAVIAPGGSVALAWSDGPFYNDHGADIRVHGPVGHRVPYVIFARTEPEEPWVRFDITRTGFADGTASHDFGHHGIARAQQIMIRNEGRGPLYIDAVTPLHRQPETHAADEPADHQHSR